MKTYKHTGSEFLEVLNKLKEKSYVIDGVDSERLISFFDEEDGGFLNVDDEHYAIFINVGKLYAKPIKNIKKLGKEKKDIKDLSKEIHKYIYQRFYKVIPNSFLVVSDIDIINWNDNPIIKSAIDAYPCYNFLTISNKQIDEKLIEESNNTRRYDASYDNTDKELFVNDDIDNSEKEIMYYDCIREKEVTEGVYCYYISRFTELLKIFDDYRKKSIPMLLPKNDYDFNDKLKHFEVELNGFEAIDKNGAYFNSKIGGKTLCYLYPEVDFETFNNIEISLNLFSVYEGVRIINYNGNIYQALFFYSFLNESVDEKNYNINKFKINYDTPSVDNIIENKMVSDVYSVVPIRYENKLNIKKCSATDNNFVVNNLLTGLAFQENYEFGNINRNIKEYKDRIERIDLGTFYVYVSEDPHYNYFNKMRFTVSDDKVPVRLIVALDSETHTGVLYILNMGVKNNPTEYIDMISRNSIYVDMNEDYAKYDIWYRKTENGFDVANLYKVLEYKYGIKKIGVARNLILSPYLSIENEIPKVDENTTDEEKIKIEEKKTKIKDIKSALLYGEVLFDDTEELGRIVDKKLDVQYRKKYGDSIYDYSVVHITKTTVLQYADTYRDYLAERIDFAVVNLFYIELVQMEYASIQMADIAISNFINDYKIAGVKGNTKNFTLGSKYVLDQIEDIQAEYAKSLDFWDVQVNFYSSKVILSKIRDKFEIENDLKSFNRNRAEIQQIYSDKQNSKQEKNGLYLAVLGFVLTLLSVVDVFNAAAMDEDTKWIFPFVDVLFEKMKVLYVIRLALIGVALFFFIRWLLKFIYNYIKNKSSKK